MFPTLSLIFINSISYTFNEKLGTGRLWSSYIYLYIYIPTWMQYYVPNSGSAKEWHHYLLHQHHHETRVPNGLKWKKKLLNPTFTFITPSLWQIVTRIANTHVWNLFVLFVFTHVKEFRPKNCLSYTFF